jgi:hypothetical protein
MKSGTRQGFGSLDAVIGIVRTGGEGGIRTLGTGVSPYNGLAITRFHMPGVRNQQLTLGELHHMLGKMALFGGICATIVQRKIERGLTENHCRVSLKLRSTRSLCRRHIAQSLPSKPHLMPASKQAARCLKSYPSPLPK